MNKLYAVLFILACSLTTKILSMQTPRELQERQMFNPRGPAPVYGQPLSHRTRQETAIDMIQQRQQQNKPVPTPQPPVKK